MFFTLPRDAPLPGTLAILTLSAWAQTTVIKGTVEDQNHQPLGGIPLRIERQDLRGNYRVRDRIAEFRSAWEGGRYDREVLSEVLGSLNAIIERCRLRARDRDSLAEDLGRLKELRERHDGSSDPGASRRALEAAFNEGQAAARANDYRAAIAAFRCALVIGPNQDVVWAHLAEAFENYLRLAPHGPNARSAREMLNSVEPR